MGRYYNGQIDGKFWFAVQSSDAADRFGVTGSRPAELEYYFDEDNLESVEEEIKSIEEILGDWNQKLHDFFEAHTSYNDDIAEKYGFNVKHFNTNLKNYADLLLGYKIRDCIKEEGNCSFTAEL